MKLWVVGLIALVLVGLLLFIGRLGAFDAALGRDDDETPTFYNYERGASDFFDADGSDVFVAPVRKDDQFILSGLPSYSTLVFNLPVDSRPIAGTFRLIYRLDAAQGVEGVVRVSVNGVKRAERLIDQETAREEIEIELTPTEIAGNRLDVRIALLGRGPIAECTPNDTIAAVATIEPQSGLQLELTQPVQSVRDRLALWGDLVPVEWDTDGTAANAALLSSASLIDKGYAVYIGTRGLSGSALAELAEGAPDRRRSSGVSGYPLPLVTDEANAGMRRFDRENTWRFRYDVRDLPNYALPASLDLNLAVGDSGAERGSELVVSLNGRLLYSRLIESGATSVAQSIAIPADLQKARNDLEVLLGSVSRDEIRCGAVQPITAEMLPTTVLRGGGPRLVPEIDRLRSLLLGAGSVAVDAEGLSAGEAQVAAGLLSRLSPSRLNTSGSGSGAMITAAAGEELRTLGNQNRGTTWLVFHPDDGLDDAIAAPAGEIPATEMPSVALLVTLPSGAGARPAPEVSERTTAEPAEAAP